MQNTAHRKLRRPLAEELRKLLLNITTTNGQTNTATQLGISIQTLAALAAGFSVTGAIVDSIEVKLEQYAARSETEE